VFRINEILVNPDYDTDSFPVLLVIDFQDASNKEIITHICVLIYLNLDLHTSKDWIRIREAQKHYTDCDPDPRVHFGVDPDQWL
jgi:hypothetical protein